MTAPIRVLVVDDSMTVRGAIVDILNADPTFMVVGEATDGRQAIEMCERLRPDVVTMDMAMQLLSGLAATEYIMAYCPTPIVIISSSMNRGEAFHTYDAIAAGAVDVLEKPNAATPTEDWAKKLTFVLRVASRIKVVTHPRKKLASGIAPPSSRTLPQPAGVRVVAVGASTGGPGAVRRLLADLPGGFPVPVLLVLHIGEPFDATLADWLDAQTEHRVGFATNGQSLLEGGPRVIMAPAGRHLRLANGRLYLDDGPERHSCRPSVDVLFETLASEMGASTVGVLLTGMGRDGAAGLLEIRKAGGYTIAQDEATSVVYGMPRAAVELGAAKSVLPLELIGGALTRILKGGARE